MIRELPTLVDVCRHWAEAAPQRVAFSWLADGESLKERISFARLDERARAVAAELELQTSPGDRALLLYPSGIDYVAAFLGCLYAGLVAVPAYPIHRRDSRSQRRLGLIVRESMPRVALTTFALRTVVDALIEEDPLWRGVRRVATDRIDTSFADSWSGRKIDGTTLAFLQYTSGTSAEPRGVMVRHANLLHQQDLIQRTFHQHPGSTIVNWLPLYHDMGLIGGTLQTLYSGAHCVLMSPAAFLQRPSRWLQAIGRFSATTSGGPNFAYDLCIRRVREEEKASLDLSAWEIAFNGAEPVRGATMDQFAEAFGPCGFRAEAFRPCYGLAESTLMVTASGSPWIDCPVPEQTAGQSDSALPTSKGSLPPRRVVGCGSIDGEQQVRVFDPETLVECGENELGEVWVTGPSVAAGYWRRELETTQVFAAEPCGASAGRNYLRTGDLGFHWRGQLFVAGRLKDLVIIRGRNHFPEDLEDTVQLAHPGCRAESCVAAEIDRDGEGRLLIVQEVDPALVVNPDEIVGRIRHALVREHGINAGAVVLVEPRSIPRTPSGKKQRRACGEAFLEGRLQIITTSILPVESNDDGQKHRPEASEDRDDLSAWLTGEASRVLGVPTARIGLDAPLTCFGLDSLRAAQLQAGIEAHIGITLAPSSILDRCSIKEIARAIREAQVVPVVLTPDAATPVGGSLSDAEKALWFLHKLSGGPGMHTVARAARIQGPVDWGALCSAIRFVVKRHEALRTTFPANGGLPRAHVHEWLEPELARTVTAGWDDVATRRAVEGLGTRSFSLETGPLLRFHLFSASETDHILAFVVHHIVADLWSICVLFDEVGRVYAAERSGRSAALPTMDVPYREYLSKRERRLAGVDGQRMQEYWRSALAGLPELTNLPSDRPRSMSGHFSARTERIRIDAPLVRALRNLGEERDATLFAVLLAAFQVFLHKYSGQDDIVIGSPFHGRTGASARDLVGCLTNLVVLRSDMRHDPRFADHLSHVRTNVLGALDNQEYPFQRLVSACRPRRDASRMPLCNVVFVFQIGPRDGQWPLFAIGEPGADVSVGPLQLQCLAAHEEVTAFDLTLTAAASGEALSLAWNCRTDLFDQATVLAMAEAFRDLLRQVASHPGRNISRFRLPRSFERVVNSTVKCDVTSVVERPA